MSGFDFISKMLSASWKPGAALALVAGVVRVLRDHGVSPFASLDGPLYQYLMVAGLIGAAITLVELACFGGTIIGMFLTNFVDTVVEKRDKKQLSIRNYDSLSADYADVLLYLRGHFGINAERVQRGVGWPCQM